MSIKAWGSALALCLLATAMVTACGDDTTINGGSPCQAKARECIGVGDGGTIATRVGRVCPDDKDPTWVSFTCGDDELCQNGTCVLDRSKAGLLGLCKAGAKECVSDALARQCAASGDAWVPLACQRGTVCDKGNCVPVDGGNGDAGSVQACEPKTSVCATDHAVKTCQDDGSDWVVTPCPENGKCQGGTCVLDDASTCSPGVSQCTNLQSGHRCAADGAHYEEFACPPEAPCEGAKCRGTVCTPGETKCADPAELYQTHTYDAPQLFASTQMFRCNATGDAWNLVPCAAGEYCKYDSLTETEAEQFQNQFLSWYADQGPKPVFLPAPDVFLQASCVKPECYDALGPSGETVCGDPNAPSTAKSDSYSQCEGLLPFTVPHWVPYLCQAPTLCDPSQEGQKSCSSACIPGESVCASALGSDDDGIMTCNADGEWEPAQACNNGGGKAQACYTQYPDHGGAREALCVDPVCAYIWTNYPSNGDEFGVCSGEQIRNCDANGQIVDSAQASDCAAGACSDWTTIQNNSIGRCQAECANGDTMCLDADADAETQYGGALASSPFYLECQGGTWNLDVQSCPNDALCFGIKGDRNGAGATTICGGECVPGWRQCATDSNTGASGVVTCNAGGTWDPQVDCEVGSCVPEDPGVDANGFASLDAECRFACIPGRNHCQYDQGLGSYTVATCGDDGKYGELHACPNAADSCDESVGCYQCAGPELAAALATTVDTQCALDGSLLSCNGSNRWPTQGTSCGTGMVCGVSFGRAHCVTASAAPEAGVSDAGRDAGPDAGDSGASTDAH